MRRRLVANDNHITREIVHEAEEEDPTQRRASPALASMTSGTTVFLESSTLDAMLTPELFALQPGDIVGAGGDSVKSDLRALLMVALRARRCTSTPAPRSGPRQTRRSAVPHGGALVEVVDGKCDYVVADGHHRASIEEHLQEHGLVSLSRAADARRELRVRAPEAAEGLVLVHTAQLDADSVMRLLQQLRETQGKPTAGGGMSIKHPRWAMGGHGDLADAFTLSDLARAVRRSPRRSPSRALRNGRRRREIGASSR